MTFHVVVVVVVVEATALGVASGARRVLLGEVALVGGEALESRRRAGDLVHVGEGRRVVVGRRVAAARLLVAAYARTQVRLFLLHRDLVARQIVFEQVAAKKNARSN